MMAKYYDYVLAFDDKAQADAVLDEALDNLKAYLKKRYKFRWCILWRVYWARHDVGRLKRYEYDENDPEAEPKEIIISEKYHVHLKLRKAMPKLDAYTTDVDIGHEFS